MNILIIGEFSGFAKHLKSGFESLGHHVVIVMSGDSWKEFKPTGDDIFYGVRPIEIMGHAIKKTGWLKGPFENIRVSRALKERFLYRPDLIIVTNFFFLYSNIFRVGVKLNYLRDCISKGSKLIMSVCGGDPAHYYTNRDWYKKMRISMPLRDKRYDFLIKNADAIIPTAYSYYDSIKRYCQDFGFSKVPIIKTIPLPMTIENDFEITSCVNRKIVIFHGIIRPEQKGTEFIKAAMDKLALEYPDLVECVCKGGMPYDEYIELFKKVDILVDQTYGNGWGMNAGLAAMKGKCVLTPCGQETGECMRLSNVPFVQIGPNSYEIFITLKELILNPDKIDKLKYASRYFMEEHCNSKLIAQRYLELID